MTAIDADMRAVPPARREWSWAAWLFAFACFFPYPALAIGNSMGLQVSYAAALAAIPFLVARPPGRSFRALLLLLGPLFVSMFLNHMFADVPLPDNLVKTPIGLALTVLVIWPADWLADRDLFREVLAAAGAAIVLHSLIGLLQLDSFSKGQFPLLFLFVNPSFSWTQEVADNYARYNKRPCGLFPEASAMAASLGPWVVLLAGLLLNPGLRRRLGWRRAWPVIPPVASGCLLLALSQSGSTFALMAALLVICAGEVWRMVHAPPRPSQLVMVALVLLSVASVLGYAIPQLGSGNLQGRIDISWGLRGLDPHGPHTQLRSAQRRRRGWPRPGIPDHREPLVGPINLQNRGRGGDLELGRHLLRGDGIAGRCGDAGRAGDGGGGHRTLLGRPARPVRWARGSSA